MLKQKRLWFGILLIVLLFWFLLRNINMRDLAEAITRFNAFWLIPALGIYSLGYFIRSYRWGVLLAPIKKCSFGNLFSILLIGFAVNNLLPFRLGELYRAHLNGKKEGISRSASLATIILERLFDGMAMLVILGAAVYFRRSASTPLTQDIESTAETASKLFGAAFLLLFAALMFKQQTMRLISYFISHAPSKYQAKLEGIGHTFLDGLQILQNAKESLIVLLTSVAAWTCEFSAFYFTAIGFQLAPEPLHFNSAGLLMVTTNLILMIPGTPGGLGVFELVGKNFLISIYHVAPATSVAYILVVHLLVLIPITLAGLYYLFHEGLSLQSLNKEKGDRP